MNNLKFTARNVGYFVAGGLIGAGLALLFAPVSGEEARRAISDKFEDLKEQVKQIEEKMISMGYKAVDRAEDLGRKAGL